jgi:hypothetical protein
MIWRSQTESWQNVELQLPGVLDVPTPLNASLLYLGTPMLLRWDMSADTVSGDFVVGLAQMICSV